MNPETLPLRDIHLPEAVGWWPLAIGWWLVMLLVVALVIAVFVYARRPHGPARIVRAALSAHWQHWQRHKDAHEFISGLSQTLRRIAIATDGRSERAGMTGDAWRRLLDEPMTGGPFSAHPGILLTDAHYRREAPALSEADAARLLALCRERSQIFVQPPSSRSRSKERLS